MKLGIFSHCSIDSIAIGNFSYEQVGGPACYSAIAGKNLKFEIDLFTKFGKDFPFEKILNKNKINYTNGLSERETTRFKIIIQGTERQLFLKNICSPIEISSTGADGVLINPIFDEISKNDYEKIKKESDFVFLDPQGFLRRIDSNRQIFLEKTDINLSKISAIKVDSEELFSLTGKSSIEGMKELQKRGIENVLLTNKRDISLLVKDRIYSIKLPDLEIHDTTGIGDIFCSTFSCTMIKEKDFLWALCFAGGSAQAAFGSKKIGLDKIPTKGETETNASYFYNTLKFKQV